MLKEEFYRSGIIIDDIIFNEDFDHRPRRGDEENKKEEEDDSTTNLIIDHLTKIIDLPKHL